MHVVRQEVVLEDGLFHILEYLVEGTDVTLRSGITVEFPLLVEAKRDLKQGARLPGAEDLCKV